MPSAIDILKSAANLGPKKRTVTLNDGTEFVFYCAPLTMMERARKQAQSDDVNQFALRLLINKATNENGAPLFTVADLRDLKNSVRDEDVQKLLLAVIQEDPGGTTDLKSGNSGTKRIIGCASRSVAKELGMTVQQLHQNITRQELIGWSAYFQILNEEAEADSRR